MIVTGDYFAKVCRVLQLCPSPVVITVPRSVVYYSCDHNCHTTDLGTGANVCRVLQLCPVITGDYCANVCRVLQLCPSLVITVPTVVYYSCDRQLLSVVYYSCDPSLVITVPRSVVYYSVSLDTLLSQGHLYYRPCPSLVITVPRSVVYYSCDRHW